jgi:hypothetical protein
MKPFDIVTLLDDLPAKGLLRGQVGTVVETLAPMCLKLNFADMTGGLTQVFPSPQEKC